MAARRRDPQRQPCDRAYVVLKLTGDRALYGPMARVVDPRCHLIGEQPPTMNEEFDGQHTDVVESLEHAPQAPGRGACQRRSRPGRQRQIQYAIAMIVAIERVDGNGAIARARPDDRDLVIKRYELLIQ